MANQLVDDMSAEPVPGALEPAQVSSGPLDRTSLDRASLDLAESLASPSPAASHAEHARGRARTSAEPRPSANHKRSPRPDASRDAGKPAPRTKAPRAKAAEARGTGEPTLDVDHNAGPSSAPVTGRAPAGDPARDPGVQATPSPSELDGDAGPPGTQVTQTAGPEEPTAKPGADGKAVQPDASASSEARGTALRRWPSFATTPSATSC